MITAENQFLFQRSPPYKEALREEIRKQLALLVDISYTIEGFISRSQQEQENDVLLQWKKWCDGQSFALARQCGVFVAPTLTGRVINDSLKRLLGTLSLIYMKQNGSGCATVEECDTCQALEFAEALCKQHTWDLQARADQLPPASAPVPAPPARSTPSPSSRMKNNINSPVGRYGYYWVRLSREALSLSEQSTKIAANGTSDVQFLVRPGPSSTAPSATIC